MLASLNGTRASGGDLTSSGNRDEASGTAVERGWRSRSISVSSTDRCRCCFALAALEQHDAVPERRMPGPRGLNIQQHAILEGAVFDEIEIGLADLRPIRVVD